MANPYEPNARDAITDPATGAFTEIGRILLRQLAAAIGALAPLAAQYWVSTSDPTLTNERNIGGLTSGLLKISVLAGVATPATASAGTDYSALTFKTIQVATQSDIVADSAADTLTVAAGAGVTITTNPSTDTLTIAATGGSGTVTTTGSPASGDITKFSGASSITNATAGTDYTALAFKTIQVATQSDVVADSPADTLTLAAGAGIAITTNAGTDTVTIAATGSGGTVTHTGSLTANALVLGNGAADVTALGSLGTTTTVLHGNAAGAPTFGQVAIGTDVSGLGANVATFLATPSSANLAAALTDETGTGANVFADTPTLIAPVLGTPTSGNLSNCTALPVGSVTGLGTGVATFLATPTSANLRGALTDETGGGAAVFATGPTLSAPVMTSLVSGSGTVTFPSYTGQVPIVVKSSGTSASTSSLTEVNLAVANIPALAANDMLEIRALFTFTGTAGAKTPVIRHNTSSGATTGGTNLAIVATAANILSARYLYQIQNANSVSAQVANFGVGYGTSTTTNTTGAINTGSASFINFNGLVANGGDACILVSYSVTIIPGV